MMTRARYAWDHWLGPQVTSSREVSVWLTWNREAALGSFCAKLPLRFFNEMRNLSSRRENQAKQLQAYKVLAVSRTFSEKVVSSPLLRFWPYAPWNLTKWDLEQRPFSSSRSEFSISFVDVSFLSETWLNSVPWILFSLVDVIRVNQSSCRQWTTPRSLPRPPQYISRQ